MFKYLVQKYLQFLLFITQVFFVAMEMRSPWKRSPHLLNAAFSDSWHIAAVPQWQVLQPVAKRSVHFMRTGTVELVVIVGYVDANIPCPVEYKKVDALVLNVGWFFIVCLV